MSVAVTYEMTALVEDCKELLVVLGPLIVSKLKDDAELVIKSFDVIVVDCSKSCVPIPNINLAFSQDLGRVSSDLEMSSHADLFPLSEANLLLHLIQLIVVDSW